MEREPVDLRKKNLTDRFEIGDVKLNGIAFGKNLSPKRNERYVSVEVTEQGTIISFYFHDPREGTSDQYDFLIKNLKISDLPCVIISCAPPRVAKREMGLGSVAIAATGTLHLVRVGNGISLVLRFNGEQYFVDAQMDAVEREWFKFTKKYRAAANK